MSAEHRQLLASRSTIIPDSVSIRSGGSKNWRPANVTLNSHLEPSIRTSLQTNSDSQPESSRIPPPVPHRHPSHTSASVVSRTSRNSSSGQSHSSQPQSIENSNGSTPINLSGDNIRSSPTRGHAAPATRAYSLASAVTGKVISPINSSNTSDTIIEGPFELDGMTQIKESDNTVGTVSPSV